MTSGPASRKRGIRSDRRFPVPSCGNPCHVPRTGTGRRRPIPFDVPGGRLDMYDETGIIARGPLPGAGNERGVPDILAFASALGALARLSDLSADLLKAVRNVRSRDPAPRKGFTERVLGPMVPSIGECPELDRILSTGLSLGVYETARMSMNLSHFLQPVDLARELAALYGPGGNSPPARAPTPGAGFRGAPFPDRVEGIGVQADSVGLAFRTAIRASGPAVRQGYRPIGYPRAFGCPVPCDATPPRLVAWGSR